MSGRTYGERIADTALYGTKNILTAFDLDPNKPDVAIKLIKKYSDQFKHTTGLDFMLLGQEFGISAEEHIAFTEGKYWNTMVAAADAAAPAQNVAQDITIELDNGSYFPKKGMRILYRGNTRVQGLITNVDVSTPSAPVVTVVPPNGGTLPAVTDGDTLVLFDSAWGEGTGQPSSSAPTFGKERFHLQILKDKYGITGSQLTNQTEFTVSEDGKMIGVYNVGVADTEARMLRMQENMMLLGNGELYNHANLITAGLVDGTNNFVQTSKGLIEWATDRGGVDNTVDNTNWTTANFDDIDDYLKTQMDSSPIVIGYLGGVLARRVNSQLAGLTTVQNSYNPTSALSQYLGGAGYAEPAARARAINLTFMEYQNMNRVYAFREIQSFSDEVGLGADGYNYNQYSIWFPLANVKDGKTGQKMPLASLMYKMKDGYNRRLESWTIKGADGDTANYNSEIDRKVMNYRSHIGFCMYKPNLTFLTTPA